MVENRTRSDLIDTVHHEHDHLGRLFEDIADSFEKIVDGNISKDERREIVESAADNLDMALEEMLHHFNQEEEVFFVDIEERFPELKDDIARLVEGHESMCDRTRWLQRKISGEPSEIETEAEEIHDVLRDVCRSLKEHTAEEDRIFDTVLEKMPSDERDNLLDEMQKI